MRTTTLLNRINRRPSVMFLAGVALMLSAAVVSLAAGESGDTYELGTAEPIEIQSGDDEGLTLRWIELNDSRCPKGLQCFAAGQAQLRIEAQQAGRDAEELILVLKAGRPMGDAEAQVGPYRVELLAVNPYPEAGVQLEDEQLSATFSIERETEFE